LSSFNLFKNFQNFKSKKIQATRWEIVLATTAANRAIFRASVRSLARAAVAADGR